MDDNVRASDDPVSGGFPDVRERYDWQEDHPTTAVAETVAQAVGRDPADLQPLYERIETDALDELFCAPDEPPKDVTVTFTYLEREVIVRGDGLVAVQMPDLGP